MSQEPVKVERPLEKVARVILNQPETLNALGVELSRGFREALSELSEDESVRALVISGAGRAFSSGGNLREMRKSMAGDPGAYMDELTKEVYSAIKAVMEMDKPVVAAVHGFAYGAAFNLVLACDLAVAAEGAVFCESFIRLGLIPGGYATTLLPRAVGYRRALELCLTAREIPAEEALSLGIVHKVVPPESLDEETIKLAGALAEAAPIAVRETKRLFRAWERNRPEEQARVERETQVRMAGTKDYREGVLAFFEKRKPEFKGE